MDLPFLRHLGARGTKVGTFDSTVDPRTVVTVSETDADEVGKKAPDLLAAEDSDR